MPGEEKHIPIPTVQRLSHYYRALLEYGAEGYISSGDLAGLSGLNSAIVRRDLSYFGKFGVPGRGYSVPELREKIFKILGIDKKWRIAIVGLGNLGTALMKYRGFDERGFTVVSVFDNNPKKIGKTISGICVKDIAELKGDVAGRGINMAVVTVPAAAAREVLDSVIASGIESILNFAPVRIEVPDGVFIVNIDIGIELEKLSFLTLRAKG